MIIGAEGEERKKVVARQRRNERACKRIADASEAFCEKEEQRIGRASDFFYKKSERAIFRLFRRSGAGDET